MKALSVILMTQVTQLVQEDIVLKNTWETDYIEIEIYIAQG